MRGPCGRTDQADLKHRRLIWGLSSSKSRRIIPGGFFYRERNGAKFLPLIEQILPLLLKGARVQAEINIANLSASPLKIRT